MARTPPPPLNETPADRARREKAERLAQALRANLKRRKAAPGGSAEGSPGPDAESADD